MNEFGRYAENAWRLMAPDRYAALEDPNRFFSMMGQEAESRMQMVWEQLCTTIVMLTTTVEKGRVKCHQYWPG